jgi:hypothetical protein
MPKVVWTDYLHYRMTLRGFDVAKVEHILRHSEERYLDTATGRMIAVGRDDRQLLMVPYDVTGDDEVTPVTVHSTTRQQVHYRIKSGRFQL